MSLHPSPLPPVPDQTAAVARRAFRRPPLAVRLRDEFGAVYEDADFAALFPARGRPALPPWRLALVTVLQFLEGLTDRQAADAVRARIDWKSALSLELTDPGFDYSVLSEFRSRLVAGGAEQVLLDRLLEHAAARGLVQARTKQRTDSTPVLAAVRTLNRLELVGESVRAALNALAAAAPDWLRPVARSEWHQRYDHRFEEARMPSTGPARERLLRTLGEDGAALLAAVDAPNTPPALRVLPAVAALRQVLARYYAREPADPEDPPAAAGPAVLRPRAKGGLKQAPRAVESPYESDARYCGRSGVSWVGYVVHLSETCARGLPRLVTHVDTTPAGVYESTRVDAIHAALAAKGLLPAEHFADGAYLSAALLVRSKREHGVTLRGPTNPGGAWQGRAGGFTPDKFRIDWRRRRVTCPAGQLSNTWSADDGAAGDPAQVRAPFIKVRFAPSVCGACALRARCVRTPGRRGRQLALHPRAEQEALTAARARHASPAGRRAYAVRSGIEGTVSQAVHALGLRRARYRGLAKTPVQAVATAAAINAARLGAWLAGRPLAPTRTSHFARLAA